MVNRLRNWRNEFKVKCERKAPEKEVKFEQELHQTRMKFQSELQAAKAAQKESSSDSKDGEATTKTYAKLPKLEITKFNGTYQDWIRFWGQFEETIDKTGVPNVTKFSYLRELLNAQVRRTVEALPFTSEGYNRAKSILKEKHGKNSDSQSLYEANLRPANNPKRQHQTNSRILREVILCCAIVGDDGEFREDKRKCGYDARQVIGHSWRFSTK